MTWLFKLDLSLWKKNNEELQRRESIANGEGHRMGNEKNNECITELMDDFSEWRTEKMENASEGGRESNGELLHRLEILFISPYV